MGQTHRHLFYVEVSLQVQHNEREVEFHDLLDFSKRHFKIGATASCETMAQWLFDHVLRQYPNRQCAVSVFEDNECGAVVMTETSDVHD